MAAEVEEEEFPAGEFLVARTVRLEDGRTAGGKELHQHRPVRGQRRPDGYARLDNEVLAGRRLHQVADYSYPRELSHLYGDESTSADPYALFEPPRGEPLRAVGEHVYDEVFDTFVTGLLIGLCWLAGAGIAHRAISPDTVLWDDKSVQITDLSRSAPFGTARTPVRGTGAWIPRESRPSTCYGTVGPTDDVWAAVRLIYFVRSRGEDLDDLGKLAETGLAQMFNGALEHVFGPPEGRPTAGDLIEYGLRRPHLIPSLGDGSKPLISGRERFLQARERKHPGAHVPGDFWDDITRSDGRRGTAGRGDGAG